MPDLAEFVSVVAPSLFSGLTFFLIFCYVRELKPRLYGWRTRAPFKPPNEFSPEPPSGMFAWIRTVIDVPEEFVAANVGMDAVVYLRFLRLGLHMFLACSVLGVGVAIVNLTGQNKTHGFFERMSMSNIAVRSPRLWFHLGATWMFSILVYWFLHKYYKEIIELSHAVVKTKKATPNQYTLMVTAIPASERSDKRLASYFKKLYPDRFLSATMARNTEAIDEKIEEFKECTRALEHAQAVYKETEVRPEHKVTPVIGKTVDSISFYAEKVKSLRNEIAQMRKQDAYTPVVPVGFVSFKSLSAAAQAAMTRHSSEAVTWEVQQAPDPRDVYWPNLRLDHRDRFVRQELVSFWLFVLIIFWAVPVSFLSSLTSLESLSDMLPFLEPLVDYSPVLKAFLQGFLPTLGLAILMGVLPSILRVLVVLSGETTKSGIEASILAKYYSFQVFHVFLVTTVSGTLFQSLNKIINKPQAVFKILGKSLPKAASFFINYVVLRALGEFPMELVQIGPLIVSTLKLRFLTKTSRERQDAEAPKPLDYGYWLPNHVLIFTIVLSYCVIAPMILPFGVMFFGIGLLVWKHNIVYVWDNNFDGGGTMWPKLFRYVCYALLIMQLTMVGLVFLKLGIEQGPMLMPLPLITLIFMNFYDNTYGQILTPPLPLEEARHADGDPKIQLDLHELDGAYDAPGIKEDLDDFVKINDVPYDPHPQPALHASPSKFKIGAKAIMAAKKKDRDKDKKRKSRKKKKKRRRRKKGKDDDSMSMAGSSVSEFSVYSSATSMASAYSRADSSFSRAESKVDDDEDDKSVAESQALLSSKKSVLGSTAAQSTVSKVSRISKLSKASAGSRGSKGSGSKGSGSKSNSRSQSRASSIAGFNK